MFKKTLSVAMLAILTPILCIGIANAQVLEREGIEEIIELVRENTFNFVNAIPKDISIKTIAV